MKQSRASMFGAFARKKHYSREEILEGLRDEKDRV